MWLDSDLMATLADDPPETSTAFSEWLGEQDLEQLVAVARDARETGESFGRLLLAHGRDG